MAIQVNQFQPGALASLAGNTAPNLNLPLHSITGGDDFAKSYAAEKNNQAALGLQQQQQTELARHNVAGEQNQAQQNQQEAQKIQLAQAKAVVDQLALRDDKARADRMGATSSLIYGMNKINTDKNKTPAERQAAIGDLKNQTLDHMYANGQLDKQTYVSLQNAPVDKVMGLAQTTFMADLAYQKKLDAKDVLGETKAPTPSDTLKKVNELDEAKVAAGQPALTPTERVNTLQQGLNTDISQNKMSGNPTDKAVGKANEAELTRINKEKASIPEFQGRLEAAKQALEKTPGVLMGPIQGLLGLAKFNPEAQKFIGQTSGLMLDYKNIQNMGSQGFTDKDAEIVYSVNGNINNFKGSARDLLDVADRLVKGKQVYNWIQENNIMEQSSDHAGWLAKHPEPSVIMQAPDGTKQRVLAEDIQKATAKGAKTIGY